MLIPTGHHVLIEPECVERETDWGFKVVASERDAKLEQLAVARGTILAIGPTAWMLESLGKQRWANEGDYVYYAKYGGTLLEDPESGKEYVLLNDQDVSCIIKSNKEDK